MTWRRGLTKATSPAARSCWRRSELETIQPDPEVRLRSTFLLHVEAIPGRPRDGGGPPQRGFLRELLAELLRGPDLAGRHVRLHAGGEEDRAPARHHSLGLGRALARLNVPPVERHAEERLAGCLVHVVHDLTGHLSESHGIVVDDHDRIAP